ncbi:MAG: glycosyltransferase family 4 protein [Muribaculaceae bacterium]
MPKVQRKKIIRSSTVATSLETFCKGLLKELSEKYEVVAVSSPDDTLDLVGRREEVKTVGVPMERHIAPLSDLKSFWKMVGVMRRERPWMVHSMTPKAGLMSMIAGWLTGVPVRVHTYTGLVFPTATGLTQKILILTDRILCRCATHIIPEGQGVKRDLEHYRITRKPMRVLANGNVRGIDLSHYDRTPEVMAEARKIADPDKVTYVFVGRIVGDKGVNELVEAFTRLNAEHPDTRLILVGRQEAELDPVSPATATAIASNSAIMAVGEQADVRPWLAASDIGVLPSYREGFPNSVIESGAMGLPSIVTDINGANEIIIPDENGLIVPPRDADALYRAMKLLHDDKPLRDRLASRSRDLSRRYDQTIVRQALYDFYASL